VRLFQMGRCELGGKWLIYLVMECADEDLAQVLPRRPLSAVEAREALEPALDALSFLHTRAFVLTNLRPSNILAVGDQLKLASDHLRRAGEPRKRVKELSPYDAPEMARGEITPAADVWSLGVTLVEALTQRLPTWDMPRSVDPVLPAGLPEPFAEIVRHSLQRDPAWRWTVEQIQARLERAATEPAPVPVAEGRVRGLAAGARRWFGRLAALVLLAFALVVIGLWVFQPRPKTQPASPASATTEKVQAEPQPVAPPSAPAEKEQAEQRPASKQAREQARPEESAVAPASAAAAPDVPAPRPAREARGATAGTVPGEVLEQVLPDVPQKARASIQGSVKLSVQVSVDADGKVVDAQMASPGPSPYFAGLAVNAARRWKFRPARKGDQSVASEWLLQFQFNRSGTTVKPQPVAP
jgi:TonB family protein